LIDRRGCGISRLVPFDISRTNGTKGLRWINFDHSFFDLLRGHQRFSVVILP
jgi:hypothetical protein